jgi:hypothetical protein
VAYIALKAAMQEDMGGGVVWVPEVAKVMEVPRFKDEDGYGEIRKVRITKITYIPTIIDFAGKKSKTTIDKHKLLEWLVEALACMILNPIVIKFCAIHFQTMEAYILNFKVLSK